jgi:hypothetical protein
VAKDQEFEPLDVAKVSPFIIENHELAGFLLIPWLLPDSVVCEELKHKISTLSFQEGLGIQPSINLIRAEQSPWSASFIALMYWARTS